MPGKIYLITPMLVSMCLGGCRPESVETSQTNSDLFSVASSAEQVTTPENWTSVVSPRTFTFPTDHAAHDDHRIEWWYYTGHLEADSGRRFGYQLTFFRTGIDQTPTNPSTWAVRDLYTAHFAVSDIETQQHHCFQRNSRQGTGQAGAEANHYTVWNAHWKVELDGECHRLQALEDAVGIDLRLCPEKPVVLHGDSGMSQKGQMTGNASHYYSFTRMATTGTVQIDGTEFRIQGHSWMDHEFSTSFLEPDQVGWDWFSIQLDNGVDLMVYRMRRKDGTTDPFSSGTFVRKDGSSLHLTREQFQVTPTRTWTSGETQATYPLDWNIVIPDLGYELVIQSVFDDQEMTTRDTTGITYWEGAITVTGERGEDAVTGHGYMELTGYTGQGLGRLFD